MSRTTSRHASRGRTGWAIGSAILALLTLALVALPAGRADAQQATPTPTPTSYAYEDTDPYVTYEGNWDRISDPKAHGGTLQRARQSGSRVILRFYGPYVKVYSVYGPNKGRMRITVDGVDVSGSPFDLYRSGDQAYERVVWAGGLDETHLYTLVIEALGQRNGASTDTQVDLDWIEVQSAEKPPITPTPSATPSPTATPTALPTVSPIPSVTVTALRSPGSWPIDSRFLTYYAQHDGQRILGNTLSPITTIGRNFSQYFEKGRIEDHSGESPDPNWQLQYGLLVDELQNGRVNISVGGEVSTITYSTINTLAQEAARVAVPAGFTGGTVVNADGSVFVPYSDTLRPSPGHNVSPIFWPYINRQDIFPGGWLHDVGLPMTEAVPAVVTKGTLANRQIFVQVFQRTVLTYDPLNPADFQVERANVGTDYRNAFPDRVPQQ